MSDYNLRITRPASHGPQLVYTYTVLDSISDHISTSVVKAVQGFWSANEDEDTLTGHLGACLRTGKHTVMVAEGEISGPWKWSIDYAKFRGRGKKATESYLGADGILELSLEMGHRTDTKSLLFQSKTNWVNSPEFIEQAILMSTWREAAIGINYTPNSFEAYSLDSILASRGVKAEAEGAIPLQHALSQYFIRCKIGNTDLRYDPRKRRLYWRDVNGLFVAVEFSVPQRIRLHVEAPTQHTPLHVDKELTPAEINLHRMGFKPEAILMPVLAPSEGTAKAIKRTLALAYHPDQYSNFNQRCQDLATRRMQEVNSAFDELSKREK